MSPEPADDNTCPHDRLPRVHQCDHFGTDLFEPDHELHTRTLVLIRMTAQSASSAPTLFRRDYAVISQPALTGIV